jgi:hypothetical protein
VGTWSTVTAGYDADPETVIRLLNASLARGDHVLMACTAVVAPDSGRFPSPLVGANTSPCDWLRIFLI